jgi:hypothetical protein
MSPTERENPTDCLAERRAQILAAVEATEAALARGEGRVITQESMRNLAAEIKQRGRANEELQRLRDEIDASRLAEQDQKAQP